MTRKINVLFLWKSMGISAYVPIIVSLLLVIVMAVNTGSLVDSMPVIELLFPIFGCFWSVFVLHDLLSEKGGEVLFSLPVRRWYYGTINVLVFFLLYIIVMVIMLLLMSKWLSGPTLISLGLQLGAQSFFYSGLGFIAMVLTRNTGWAFIMVTLYLSVELLTVGHSIHIIDIYLHNAQALPISELRFFLRKVIILGAILFINAQYFLSSTRKYK